MKYLLTLFALFTIFIYGCGNDSTTNTNNNGNGETVIYSLDSLSINLNTSSATNDIDIITSNTPNIKITFNCSTNVDSVNSSAFYRITAGDSNSIYIDTLDNNISSLNANHVININASLYFSVKIFIQANRINSIPYFIRLKNIKMVIVS